MSFAGSFLEGAMSIAVAVVILSIVLGFVRIVLGPTLADRVVALDMMTTIIAAFCGLAAVFTGHPAFVDVALVVALVGFLSTVALARYAETRTEAPQAGEDGT